MLSSPPLPIVLAAFALALWPHEPAAAEPPRPVRTPEPYRPSDVEARHAARRPLPVVAPADPVPPRQPALSLPAPAQVIQLVLPPVEGGEVTMRLEAPPGTSPVELRVRRGPSRAPAPPPQAPAALPPEAAAALPPAPVAPARPLPPPEGRLGLRVGVPFVGESYPAGALDVAPGPVPALGLSGALDLVPGWSIGGAGEVLRYTLVDTQHAASRHQRQEVLGSAAIWGALPTGGQLGLGYWGRLVTVTSSLPPPLTTPLLTSPSQLYHGPQALARAAWPLAPGLAASVEVAARPFIVAAGDEAVGPLSPLFGFAATAEVRYRLGEHLALTAGLAAERQASYAVGFAHTKLGPLLRLEGRF